MAPILGVQLKLLASGSLKAYTSSWANWRKWVDSLGAAVWPVESIALCLCMLSYLQEQASESKILGIHAAVLFLPVRNIEQRNLWIILN